MTTVICAIYECKRNDNGVCTADKIYVSDDYCCDGGCDDGWEFPEGSEEV